jgi:MFS family permease
MDISYRHLRKNVKNNLAMGISSAAAINFTVPFFAVIAAKFGATNTDYALLNSVPALMTIISTIPASAIISRFRHQKRIAVGIMLASRLCFLLMALLPLFQGQQVKTLIMLVGLYTAANSLATISWQSILGEIIPVQYRNKVFAERNIWGSLTGMAVVLIAGWYIDRYAFPTGYQVAYLLGAIGGLLECWFFLRLRVPSEDVALAEDAASGPVAQTPHAQEASGSETSLPFQASPDLHTSPETADFQASSARQASPEASTSGDLSSNSVSTLSEQPGLESAAAIPAPSPAPSPTPLPKRRLLSRIVNSLKFKAGPEYYLFCIAAVIFTFAWMAAWPVFTKLKVDVLQATNMQISIDTVGSAIGSLIGFRYWARLIEKKGNAGTLFMATMAVAANPLMWLFANSMTAVYFIDMFGACATAGYTLALFNRQLEIVPAASRQKSIAFYTTLSQISAVIAPIVGMKLFESIDFAGTMWISTLVRIFGSLCFLVILQPFVGNWLNKRAKQS